MTQGNLSSITETAFEALRNNISILPIKADGSKKPILYSWDTFKTTRPNFKQVNNWFNNNFHYGIGIIGGIVSENLEVLDFDKKDYFLKYSEAALKAGLGELLERLKKGYFEQTPNGFHLAWRCPDGVEGNKKLARIYLYNSDGTPKLIEGGKHDTKATIETRGEGGYAIIAPSNGTVHPSGKGYQLIKGSLSTIPVITGQERAELLNLARTLDEVTEHETIWKPKGEINEQEIGGRPGDDFNSRANWETILTPHGWKPIHKHGNGKIDWRRPGKNDGISATTNHADSDLLYVFSSSTIFEQERGYSKFSAYTILNHQGDFSVAAKELVKQGYGEVDERAGVGIDFGGFEGAHVDKATNEAVEGPGYDLKLAEFEATDEGNADAFRSIYGQDFINCNESGWLAWNGKFWDADLADALIDEKVTEILRRRRVAAVQINKETVIKTSVPNRSRINSCLESLEKRLKVNIKDFDNKPDLLNCNNGYVDLKTGKLYPHDKSQRFTYAIRADYNPQADYSVWADFLSQVIGGGNAVIDYLKKAIGYSLTGYTSEECLFYCYGPTRSGKGTFTEALLQLLGDPISAEIDFNTFTAPRDSDNSNFDLAQLKPSRILFASESTRYRSLNAAKIKALTGGNQVRCCFKHKNFFSYRPAYSIWLTSNWPVNGDVDDDALWGRIRVIEFPNSFLGKEDKSLKTRIKDPKTLEGILAWAVEGAREWYKAGIGGLKAPEEIKKVTTSQRNEADFVQMWLDECTELDEASWESNSIIMESYQKWCTQNGIEAKHMRSLSLTFKQKGLTVNVLNRRGAQVSKGVQGFKIL
jgi:putative DNA primase/helicase